MYINYYNSVSLVNIAVSCTLSNLILRLNQPSTLLYITWVDLFQIVACPKMHCTCTDINKSLVGLFAYVPSLISEEKKVGLWTGYRIVKGVNKPQSQGCSSSSTPWIETYPVTRKSFSKLTRATQQEQAISVWKLVVSTGSRFDTNSSSTNAQKWCSLQV